MGRVKANTLGETPLGSIVEPCEKTGVLCIYLYDDNDKPIDEVFLRVRKEEDTAHTDIDLKSSDKSLYVSEPTQYFQKGGFSAGDYELFFVQKPGMDFKPFCSTAKFEIASGCYTVIKLYFEPQTEDLIQDHIPERILENRELLSQMEADIPDDAAEMHCSDQCMDFRGLLEMLSGQTPLENSKITLLGVHDKMPFSIFNELRGAFDVVDYASTASNLKVSPVNLKAFLGGMHKNAMKVIFLVPPQPRAYPFKRTSLEFIWYNDNRDCKEHVFFVFGAYRVVSQENIVRYLSGKDEIKRKRLMLRQYSECLKPQPPCPELTIEKFRQAREEFEAEKNRLAYVEADDGEEIDFDSI